MHIAIGHSEDPSAPDAIQEAITAAKERLRGPPLGALLYSAIDMDHQALLDGVQAEWPGLPLIGCTTDGECSSELEFTEDSVVLILLHGEQLILHVGCSEGVGTDAFAAARSAVEGLGRTQSAPPPLTIAVAESIGVSGATLVEALNTAMGPGSLIVGGTAGDQWAFSKTFQFFNDQVLTDACPILTIDGPLKVSVGVESGWKPMGRRCSVTKAAGNILHELDGRPAIEVFQSFFGPTTSPTPQHPFAVYNDNNERFFLRAPFPDIREDGGIVLAGDISVGSEVQVTEAGRDEILVGAKTAMQSALDTYPGDAPSALLMFSCAARKQVLGTRCAEEIGLLRSATDLPLDVAGFYTYGEIAPLHRGERAEFHNETVVAVLVGT